MQTVKERHQELEENWEIWKAMFLSGATKRCEFSDAEELLELRQMVADARHGEIAHG